MSLKSPLIPVCDTACPKCAEWKSACTNAAWTAERALAKLMEAQAVIDAARALLQADIAEYAAARELAGALIDALQVYDGTAPN